MGPPSPGKISQKIHVSWPSLSPGLDPLTESDRVCFRNVCNSLAFHYNDLTLSDLSHKIHMQGVNLRNGTNWSISSRNTIGNI